MSTDGSNKRRVAIACQGGGSHTAFTARVLEKLMENLPEDVEVVALSGTSGGAIYDQLWLIQINSSTCARIPTKTHEILDRRNALAGNLSMEQEVKFIEMINRSIARGKLTDSKFRQIRVSRIAMDRELSYKSKLDRSPELLEELRVYGQTKCRSFLKDRQAQAAVAVA